MAIALDKDVVFNPISFENFVAPFQIYKQAYDQVDAKYDELSKAAQLEFQMASEQDKNSEAYKKYKAYMDGLNEAVADFSTGMTLQNRTALGNFKKRYSSDIVPVENALKRRLELSEEQRKMAQQDRTLVFEKDAKDLDLDDIIANPAIGYGKSFSGKEVAAYAANMAKTLQKVYGDMYAAGALTGNDYQTIMKVITTKGIDLDSLNAFLKDPNNKNLKYYNDLAPIMENIYEITGVRDWKGYMENDYYQMLKPYLTQGMQEAIGDRSYTTVSLTNPKPTEGGVYGKGGKDGKDGSSSPYYNALNILLSNKYNDLKERLERAGLFKNGKLTDTAKKYLGNSENRNRTYSTSPIDTSTVGEPQYPSFGTVTTPVYPVFYNEGSQLLDTLLEYAQQYNNLVHWEPSEKESKTKRGKIAITDIEALLNNTPDFIKKCTQYLVPQRTNISNTNNIISNLDTISNGAEVPVYEMDVENTRNNGYVTMKKTTKSVDKSKISSKQDAKGHLDIQGVFVTGNGLYARLSDNSIVKINSSVNPNTYGNLINNYINWAQTSSEQQLFMNYDNAIQQGITNLLGDVDAATLKQQQQYE